MSVTRVGTVGHATQHEDRSALDSVVSDQPIQFNVDTLRASYLAPFGRWSFAPEIGVERWQYDPTTISGHPTSEAYRDRVVLRGGTTIRYEWAPSRNLVFVARALSQRYTSPLFGQPSSDSTGLQMLVGFEYGSDPVWRARVLAGAESRHFAYAGYRPHDGAIAEMAARTSSSSAASASGVGVASSRTTQIQSPATARSECPSSIVGAPRRIVLLIAASPYELSARTRASTSYKRAWVSRVSGKGCWAKSCMALPNMLPCPHPVVTMRDSVRACQSGRPDRVLMAATPAPASPCSA